MKFVYSFYKFHNIGFKLNILKECQFKKKCVNLNKCKNLCKKGEFNCFMIYKDFSYYFRLNIYNIIDKLYYNDKCLFFIYTNEDLNFKTEKERVMYYTYGLYNFVKKNEKIFSSSGKKIFYNLRSKMACLDYNDFELHPSYKIMNYDVLNSIVKNMNDSFFIKRHFKKFLELITNLKIKKKKIFKVSPYDMAFSCKLCTFCKSRLIRNKKNSILLPLEDVYLPYKRLEEIKNDIPFEKKQFKVVWRGSNSGSFDINDVSRGSRRHLVEKYYNDKSKIIDVGITNFNYNKNYDNKLFLKLKKKRIEIEDQLKSKFIICVEGNDFPTNLLWVFLSNSVPLMPKPIIDTWFMEGNLKEWIHYVPLKNDFSDLKEKINYCYNNLKKCKKISINSKLYAIQFLNINKENKIINEVIKYYFDNVI